MTTSWFLTVDGWRETEDPVAIWDAEVWPSGTVVAGVVETPDRGGPAVWRECWRDRWINAESIQDLQRRFGEVPPLLTPVAA